MKRKHAEMSTDGPPIRSSLTAANLESLQRQLGGGSQSSTKNSRSSHTSATSGSSNAEAIPRLRLHGIYVDSIAQNTEVNAFAQKLLATSRPSPPPRAKCTLLRAPIAEQVTEASGRRYVQDMLLVKPAQRDTMEDSDAITKVWPGEDSHLDREFSPPLHYRFGVPSTFAQAVPDASFGYITYSNATAGGMTPALPQAFTREEDTILRL